MTFVVVVVLVIIGLWKPYINPSDSDSDSDSDSPTYIQSCNECVKNESETLYKIWDNKQNICIDYNIGAENLDTITDTSRNNGNFVIPGSSSTDTYWQGELFKDADGCNQSYTT